MTGIKYVEQLPSHLATWQKRKFCLHGTPNESLCRKKMLKVRGGWGQWGKRMGMGEHTGNTHDIGVLIVIARLHARPVSGGNMILEPGLVKPLKPPKKRALVGLRLCNRQPQRNALLPSGSVYFLNINLGDRFKACLEIKHIIMWAELTRTIYCTLHLFWANRRRAGD